MVSGKGMGGQGSPVFWVECWELNGGLIFLVGNLQLVPLLGSDYLREALGDSM